ncbi:MAG: tetratricopeptide repeat protein [Erythrobacter sp.]|nr:tetratricopeptide repeat protein [Erythrobacter sp.]
MSDYLASSKETLMRYAPAAAALSLMVAVTASVGSAQQQPADPRAEVLMVQAQDALDAGQPQRAVDALEAALAIDPQYTPILIALAEAARREGLQGKAIRYYREALTRDPRNYLAIAGEGAAMVEKGAVDRARRNLAQLESLCGSSCDETRALAMAIEQGPKDRTVLTAEAVMPDAMVTQNLTETN